MARPRKMSGTLESIEECREAMRKLLLATIERERLEGARDKAVAGIFREYEKSIDEKLRTEVDLRLQLQQYCVTHRGEKKSVDLMYGVMGLRTTPPALKLLNKAWTWAAALVKLREKYGSRFLRQREPEIDKDLVKAEIPEAELAELGLRLDQTEEFYIDLNRQAAEAQ